MHMKPKAVLIYGISFVLFIACSLMAGTTGKITGIVTDGETNEPLPGVNIVV